MANPFQSERWQHFSTQHSGTLRWAQLILLPVLGFALAWALFHEPSGKEEASEPPTPQVAAGPDMWTCSMHPQIRQPNPGACPICAMPLVPVSTTPGGLRTITLSPESLALMNIELTPVERRYVTHQIRMVGKVDYDETKLGYIAAWVPGRLDRLYVDYTGVQVNRGDHMVYIYSPELYAAQEELIQALKYRRDEQPTRFSSPVNLVESAREKLRLLGLTEAQIKEIEQQDKPTDHLTIYSPVSGIVIHKMRQEGDYVSTGERIYTVADLNQVWVHLDAYESDLPWIRYGQDVTITTEAYPGAEFHGRIAFIQPVLDDKTRTVKVRVNVPNPAGRLKPDMFVRAIVRPEVAAGGRVMDPSLIGKWISPMHPEIVRDEPGTCPICGMPLVRADSLGYVTPETDEQRPPLVIPYSAALATGTRAVVYVELPNLATGVETAFQGVAAAVQTGTVEDARSAFGVFANVLDRPYDQPGTDYAKQLWSSYADRLSAEVLKGQRAKAKDDVQQAFARIEDLMNEVHEQFALPDQPTFEGREIVLGPRAGDYYLVRHGLQSGELVVTRGNFKIDAEIQIQAKPSMMTPEGGGGGGHHHGGPVAKKTDEGEHAAHQMALPAAFSHQLAQLGGAYDHIAQSMQEEDLGKITATFTSFKDALNAVDAASLNGHARMQWKEFSMLLGNDAAEGSDVDQLPEADRVFLLLKNHMRRMREQMGLGSEQHQHQAEHIAVSSEFQSELAAIWERYLAIQQELANDDLEAAREVLPTLKTAIATVSEVSLAEDSRQAWEKEQVNLDKLTDVLKQSEDIQTMRAAFLPLSQEIGLLAKTFGFGEPGPVYELHCPMAFDGRGAVWYQDEEDVHNPYFGAMMLKCADRVKRVVRDEPAAHPSQEPHAGHTQH